MKEFMGLGSSTPAEAALVLNGVFYRTAFLKLLHNGANHKLAF